MLSPIALIAFGFGRPREEGDMKNAGIPPIHGDGAHPKIEMRGRTPDSAGFWPLLQLSTESPAIRMSRLRQLNFDPRETSLSVETRDCKQTDKSLGKQAK